VLKSRYWGEKAFNHLKIKVKKEKKRIERGEQK